MIYVILAIVGFNLFLIVLMAVVYFRGGVRDDRLDDLEEFCASLPRNAHIPDPCVLRNQRWLCRNTDEKPHSA